eukprot:1158487-Pelagomonas_calceolata.AAC.4
MATIRPDVSSQLGRLLLSRSCRAASAAAKLLAPPVLGAASLCLNVTEQKAQSCRCGVLIGTSLRIFNGAMLGMVDLIDLRLEPGVSPYCLAASSIHAPKSNPWQCATWVPLHP